MRPVVVACLGGITAFQVSLAAGAPLAALAYGGGHEGVLPTSLRVTSAVASLLWGGALVAVATGRPHDLGRQRALYAGLAAVSGVGALVNLASPSLPERFLWVPVTAVLAVAAWHEARSLRPWRAPARPADDLPESDDAGPDLGSPPRRRPSPLATAPSVR
ncbi:hypothetical protein [Oryzobacter terrae]|uniref:hypothetical protein n=1 Tax=Oryzobacter terrae TaxID=1620385 RepID=UPI00366EE770